MKFVFHFSIDAECRGWFRCGWQDRGNNMRPVAKRAHALSMRLNRVVELIAAGLIGVLVVDVWFGVGSRYLVDLGATWTEELARYLMIWAALLAVSCGVAKREHVAVTYISDRVPGISRRILLLSFDILAFLFFATLFYYGLTMTRLGSSQYTTLFGVSMLVPYAAVPVSAGIACIQVVLVALRDYGGEADHPVAQAPQPME